MSAKAAEQQQAAQTGLTIVASDSVQAAVPSLDVHNLQVSTPNFTRLVQAIVNKYGRASATLSAKHYVAQRREAGLGGISVNPADPPGFDDVQSTVEWAVSPLYGPEPDEKTFQRRLDLGVGKLVQDTGRNTVINTANRDRKATGWERVPEPSESHSGTCAFCAMLTSRGATYKSRNAAAFHAHDGCNCHPEAVFGAYVPSDQVKAWKKVWADSTKGRTGKDARAAFRQAIEGRPVTGLTRGPNVAKTAEPEKLSPVHSAKLISQLEAANQRAAGNPKLAKMIAANTARISALRAA